VTPASVAAMEAEVLTDTVVVVMVNVAEVAPAVTVTLVGAVATALFEVRLTTTPPAGAALYSVTVPVADVPPTMELGDTETPLRPEGVSVSVVDLVTLP